MKAANWPTPSENRLSRSGVKETTLDYTRDFAERRGIAEQMGVRSEIELRPDREPTQEQTRAERQAQRPSIEAEKVGEDPRQVSSLPKDLAQDRIQDHGDDRQQRPRRGMFDGLKLGRGAAAEGPQQDRAETAQERPERAETPRRGMFDGLKLNAASTGQAKPERGARGEALAPDRQAERLRRPSEMERAIDRYARAYDAAERNHREGLPILETQKQEVRLAGQQLDQARPGASALMVSALQHDPEARAAMQELSGRERVGQLSAGMDRERTALADPNVRAERFVQRWQELQGERQELRGWRHDEARGQVEGQMRGMTKSLERDPQVESILRNRSQDLGIGHVRQSESLARNMEQSLARGRSQNLGMER